MTNPYRAPGPAPAAAPPSRTPFVLAGIGGFAAAGYWAVLTLLFAMALVRGSNKISFANVVVPGILIVMYVHRSVLVLRGDARSATSLLWLHGVGGLLTAFTLARSDGMVTTVLDGVKLAIHVFGGVAAYVVTKARHPSDAARY